MDGRWDEGWLLRWFADRGGRFCRACRDERGFTLIELLVVVVIIGVLAAVAIPTYVGQQSEAKDTAAQAALRTAATAQQLYYANSEDNSYATTPEQLESQGFNQGEPEVTVNSGSSGDTYCMQAEGGNGPFRITQGTGTPEKGGC